MNRFSLPQGFCFANGFPFSVTSIDGVGILMSCRRSLLKENGIGVGPRAMCTLNVYNRACTLALAFMILSISQLFGLFNQPYQKNPQSMNVFTHCTNKKISKIKFSPYIAARFPAFLLRSMRIVAHIMQSHLLTHRGWI